MKLIGTTKNKNIIASVDIEADGPSVVCNSMISIGIVFFDSETKEVLAEFLGDIEPLIGHIADPATITEFWHANDNNKKELKRIQDNAKPFNYVFEELNVAIEAFEAKRVTWVARPAAFDLPWVIGYQTLYLQQPGVQTRSLSGNPKRQLFSGMCISTMREAVCTMYGFDRKQMDARIKEWNDIHKFEMTHNPLDDARYQMIMFNGLLELIKAKK